MSKKATREFIKKFGVKKPSLRNEIYNKIIPTYSTDEAIDTTHHFMKFFRYFKEGPNDEVAEFVELIEDMEFLLYTAVEDDGEFRSKAEDIYLPTPDLKVWFEAKPDTRFLSLSGSAKVLSQWKVFW